MKSVPKKTFAYGSVIEALSFGLYPQKEHVIREFIQNSYDALDEWRKLEVAASVDPIYVRVEPPSIFIMDKGVGMDFEQVRQFRYLGYSEKQREKNAGFRGIGKDSGFAVAERIIVTTTKYNVPRKFTVAIDAKEMLEAVKKQRNPPLDEILEKHSQVSDEPEARDAHYTVVELNGIRKDAETLFDTERLENYIRKTAPIPFDPGFKYSKEIMKELQRNIPNFFAVNLDFNGKLLYKPFLENCTRPNYEEIFASDEEGSPLIAFCWYCQNNEKGQFEEKEKSGLIFRVKNFAVGDRHLSRKELWQRTPERASYFFGEIHVIDTDVIPSSDRSNFEDTEARQRLYTRSTRIAQVLSRKAGEESAIRRFEEVTGEAKDVIRERNEDLRKGDLPQEIRPDIEFSVRKLMEDVEKRLSRSQGKRTKTQRETILIREAENVVKKAKRLIRDIEKDDSQVFYNLEKSLKFNEQTRAVYRIIVDCLREEFAHDKETFEAVIEKIHSALRRGMQR